MPAKQRRRAVLLLCHFQEGSAGTVVDHIRALEEFSENDVFVLSNLGELPGWLDLSRFDALIFHYSLIASSDNYISPAGRQRIREFAGFKAAFVQDDYRWIDDTVNALSYMRIHALFPLTNPDIMDRVYDPRRLPGVRKETVLAGYVPENLLGVEPRPYAERSLDVGYRARKLPAWMGSHTLQKWQIAERFEQDARVHGLKVDLSSREEDRIYGQAWIEFIRDCRATLGTESGASVCDFTGDIQRKVEAHLRKYPDCEFETLRDLYFREEDCRIMMNVISPRCFEAAALRTLMVLYEGEYSGILKPWRHYVPLRLDHSNMEEVVRILKSPQDAQRIIDQAYREVACNEEYSFKAMVRLVDRVMDEEWRPAFDAKGSRYGRNEFDWFASHRPVAQAAPLPILGRYVRWFERSAGRLDLGGAVFLESIAIRAVGSARQVPRQAVLKGWLAGQPVFEKAVAPGSDGDAWTAAFDGTQVDELELDEATAADAGGWVVGVTGTTPLPKPMVVDESNPLVVWAWSSIPRPLRLAIRPVLRPMRSMYRSLLRRAAQARLDAQQ